MKPEDEKLSEAETWSDGHLSEVALSCIADAQDVVDPVARVHAESCAECMLRVGAMALESHDVGAALNVARQLRVRAAAPAHRFPTTLVVAAALVALAAGLPAALDAIPNAVAWAFDAPRIASVLADSAIALGRGLSPRISLVATFALALLGYAVARVSRETSHGASQ